MAGNVHPVFLRNEDALAVPAPCQSTQLSQPALLGAGWRHIHLAGERKVSVYLIRMLCLYQFFNTVL